MQLHSKTRRLKSQSLDFDDVSANSPPWPPVKSPGQFYVEDDRESGQGEWVDKVMVNKQDESTLGGWESDSNGQISEVFYQKYLQDSSKLCTERSFNMLMGGNQFNLAGSDDMDDLDAVTSDSSEPDLLWQYNHSKLTTLTSGNASNPKRPISKLPNGPELR